MGIPTIKLCYDFKRKAAQLHAKNKEDLPLVDIIAYLNESLERIFTNRVSVAETNSEIRNHLRIYEIKNKKLACKKLDDRIATAEYPEGLFKILNQKAVVKNDDCCQGIVKDIILRTTQSDDINESRISPYRKADFRYEQLPWDEGGNSMFLYHEGEMDILEVIIDYYRRPNELHAPSLEKCNNGVYYDYCGRQITKDTFFEEGHTFSNQDVSDLAVACYKRDIGDYNSYKTAIEKITISEKIHKV